MQILPGASRWASWRKGQQEQTLIRTGMDGKITCSVLLREREGAPEDFEHQDGACPRGSGEACRWKSFLEAVKLSGHIENGPAGEDAGERVSG